jgi:hypothetical protein
MTVSAGLVFNIRTTVRFGSSSSPLRMENNAYEPGSRGVEERTRKGMIVYYRAAWWVR